MGSTLGACTLLLGTNVCLKTSSASYLLSATEVTPLLWPKKWVIGGDLNEEVADSAIIDHAGLFGGQALRLGLPLVGAAIEKSTSFSLIGPMRFRPSERVKSACLTMCRCTLASSCDVVSLAEACCALRLTFPNHPGSQSKDGDSSWTRLGRPTLRSPTSSPGSRGLSTLTKSCSPFSVSCRRLLLRPLEGLSGRLLLRALRTSTDDCELLKVTKVAQASTCGCSGQAEALSLTRAFQASSFRLASRGPSGRQVAQSLTDSES